MKDSTLLLLAVAGGAVLVLHYKNQAAAAQNFDPSAWLFGGNGQGGSTPAPNPANWTYTANGGYATTAGSPAQSA